MSRYRVIDCLDPFMTLLMRLGLYNIDNTKYADLVRYARSLSYVDRTYGKNKD
jgi:hypothetical protein